MATNDRDDAMADVRAAMEQISKGGGESPPTPNTALQPAQTSDASPPSDADDAQAALDTVAERARDPDTGKFVKAAPEKAAPEPAAKPITATTEAREAPQPAPSTAPTGKPPPGWSPEAKAAWATFPPAVQQAVLKREEEVSSGFKQKSDELRRLQEIDGIVAPRRAYYQRFGFKSDAEAINHLMTLSDSMERDPASTIAHLAQHYRVDLARMTGGQPQQPQQQQPQIQPQQQNIPAVVREQIQLVRAQEIVSEFEQSPPEHYQDVKPLMKQLLEIGQANDMQDAYDKAVWMTPELREKKLEAQKAEEEAKRQAAATPKLAQKLKASNASLNGAPHGTPSNRPNGAAKGTFGEVTDDVRAAISQLSG